jgi:hypothetical protein
MSHGDARRGARPPRLSDGVYGSLIFTPQEKEFLQPEIGSTDQAIDTLVYELYGLGEEEIKIVEGG